MTLIVKELIIKGNVTSEHSSLFETSIEKEELLNYLEQIKKEIKQECMEQLLERTERKMLR